MNIIKDIRSYLAGRGTITALVGTRFSVSRADVGTKLPYIVLELSGHEPTYGLTGETGTASTDVEVTAYADSAMKAFDVAMAIRDALSGYNANLGVRSRNVSVLITDKYSGYETPDDGSDKGAYYSLTRFSVVHNEPLPTGVPSGAATG